MPASNKEELEGLKRENQLLKAIIDNIHEGIYAINDQCEIILYNPQVEKAEGMKKENVIGKKVAEVYSFMENKFFENYEKEVMRTGKPLIEQNFKFPLADGRKLNMISSVFPFYYKGQLSAVYTIGRDATQIDDFITKILEIQRREILENNHHESKAGARYFLSDIIGSSDKIRETVVFARKVAGHDAPVLIVGETGTGKELFGQGIHNAGLCSKGPFVPVNCAAIPDTLLESVLFGTVKGGFTGAMNLPGLFEQAENGTIFLDEINSMPLTLQAKLLRVLQDKVVRRIGGKKEIPVNCRIISATNKDPFIDGPDQIIRSDLFFRLSTLVVKVPPLRERKEDIGLLCMHIIGKYNTKYGRYVDHVSDELMALFKKYHWPGNVRELENVIESSMSFVELHDRVLKTKHLPDYLKEKLLNFSKTNYEKSLEYNGTLQSIVFDFEKRVIINALNKNDWNVSKTAEEFGILRQNLHKKMRKLKIKRQI
ncbi:MAG: sigma 54-interacting transcriptional regulator [Dehalobacterium sp.]